MKLQGPKVLTCLILLLCACHCEAQFNNAGFRSARSVALGGTGVAHEGIEALQENQAAGAFQEKNVIMAGARQRYGLAELSQMGMIASIHTESGNFGLEINQDGLDDFVAHKIGLFYSRQLASKIALAVQFNYLNLSITENGTASTFSAELSALSRLTETLTIGVHLYSPMALEISDNIEVPSVFTMGLEYSLGDNLLLSAEIEKDLDRKEILRFGLEYGIHESVSLRMGSASNPGSFSFGAGIAASDAFHIDIGSTWDATLGMSPALNLRYQWD